MNRDQATVRPDEVLAPQSVGVQVRGMAKEAVLMLPNLVKLVGRLLADPRVPRRSKIALGLAAAYVASPIDLVPEVIPVVGWLDDLLVLAYVLDRLIERAGPGVVEEHWDGPGDLFALVREVLGLTHNLIPKRLRAAIDRLSG